MFFLSLLRQLISILICSPVEMTDDISSQGLTQVRFTLSLFITYLFVSVEKVINSPFFSFRLQFATSYSKSSIVRLKEIFTPGTLTVPKTPQQLKELESIHKVSNSVFFLYLFHS